MSKFPLALVILDGFGYSKKVEYNAIAQAHTPCLDILYANYPSRLLRASGRYVGIPDGQAGNSEVGHMTIGAGRVIDQPVKLIHDAIENGSFFSNEALTTALATISEGNSLHIVGIVSDGGVHGHEHFLHAAIAAAAQHNKKIVVHAILDGRDTPPRSAAAYLQRLQVVIDSMDQCIFGSIHGRFYAMDRDNNWGRTQKSYDVLTKSKAIRFSGWQEALEFFYAQQVTDEFIPPTPLRPDAIIKPEDGILCMNFRPDRARQLARAFIDQQLDAFARNSLPLSTFITPVSYADDIKTTVLYPQEQITNTLKEVLSDHDKRMFVIAETEKYAHVTYFLSGGREQPFAHETQILIQSIKKKTYVDYPQMSAEKITKTAIIELQRGLYDLCIMNYANADMVGHSGNMNATIKAVECLDAQIKTLYEEIVIRQKGTLIITADHGKAEQMFDEKTQQVKTAHTTNDVPFLYISEKDTHSDGVLHVETLADIAPFILHILRISVPIEMQRKE